MRHMPYHLNEKARYVKLATASDEISNYIQRIYNNQFSCPLFYITI